MKATAQLKAEHEGITIILKVLDQIASNLESGEDFEVGQFEQILKSLQVFVDRCHHGKEEDLLFSALEEAGVSNEGGPIGQMLLEHEQGRSLVRDLNNALTRHKGGIAETSSDIITAASNYTTLMYQHMEKENSVLFSTADSLLSAERQNSLFDEFEKLEEERIGKGVHEEFHRLLHELATIYLENHQR